MCSWLGASETQASSCSPLSATGYFLRRLHSQRNHDSVLGVSDSEPTEPAVSVSFKEFGDHLAFFPSRGYWGLLLHGLNGSPEEIPPTCCVHPMQFCCVRLS